jgi:DNA-binding HxlR family transcriptional regulator
MGATASTATASRAGPTPGPPPAGSSGPCRAREILELIGDKWSLLMIYTLGTAGTLRFSDLRRRVPAISQRMLTVTLRDLERDGLVSRALYPAVPPRVEYTLTPLGATLMDIVTPLIAWADAHVPEIDAARARYDANAGA